MFSGFVARTGEHEYPWGTERRDSDELGVIVNQLIGKPVVISHPMGLIREGAAAIIVGEVMNAWVDGTHAAVDVRVDAAGVQAIGTGAHELSLGYKLKSNRGEAHRGTQVDHVALVSASRCGDSCSIRTDGADCTSCATPVPDLTASKSRATVATHPAGESMSDEKTRADKAELALTDALGRLSSANASVAALTDERDEHKSRADSAQGEVDTLRERITAMEAERTDDKTEELQLTIKGLNTQILKEKNRADAAEDPQRLVDAVTARVALETSVLAVYGDNDRTRMDKASDREVMELVIHKLHNAKIDEDKSDDYVRARFDAAIEGFMAGSEALANVRQAATPGSRPENERADAKSSRQQMVERNRNAWKPADPKPAEA